MKGKVFVINLASAVERRKTITAQLHKQRIDFQIVDAINGQHLSPETNPEVDWDFASRNAFWVSKGLLACSLSHLKAYRAIVDQNLPYGLVLEDDTVLLPGLADFLLRIETHLHENEVLMLYYAAWEKCVLTAKGSLTIGQRRIVTPQNPRQLVSANAYIITNRACRDVLHFQTPLKTTSDSWGVYYENGAIRHIRCVYPMLADTGDYKSTIDYIAAHSVKATLLNYIDRHRIFPVYQLLKRRRKKLRTAMLNFELLEQ
jgi:glycosyl transferase family 25